MNIAERLELTKRLRELKEKRNKAYTEVLPELAKTNYADYVKYTHLYDNEFIMAPFQRYICDCIDKLLDNKLLNDSGKPYKGICLSQPPQTGKSRCVTETLPSYFLGRNPLKHVIEVSYSGDFAQKFGRRNIEKINDFGKELFGIEMSQDKKASDEFELIKTRGGMISRGIEGQITGNPADLVIVDDPYKTMSEADSPSWQKTVMDVWLSAIKMRASANCKFIVVHTRWNEDDLIGYLTSTEPDKWFEINFPMIAEQDEPVTGRQIGDPLLPEAGKTKEWVESEKESFLRDPESGGVRVWNASYQQRPSSLEGNMIKRDYWQRFDLSLKMQERGYFPIKVQSWDCALKDTSDPVAGQVWGKRGTNIYLLDHKGGRMDIVETVKGIIEWDKKHSDAIAKLIEDKANGPAAMRILRDKVGGLIPVNPGTKSKAERVNMVLPLWVAKNIWIPERIEVRPGEWQPCLWANDIIEQCAAFKPDKKVQRDDEVDAASQALNWLYFQDAPIPDNTVYYDDEDHADMSGYFGGAPTRQYLNYGG